MLISYFFFWVYSEPNATKAWSSAERKYDYHIVFIALQSPRCSEERLCAKIIIRGAPAHALEQYLWRAGHRGTRWKRHANEPNLFAFLISHFAATVICPARGSGLSLLSSPPLHNRYHDLLGDQRAHSGGSGHRVCRGFVRCSGIAAVGAGVRRQICLVRRL